MSSTDPGDTPQDPNDDQGAAPDFSQIVQTFGLQAMMACGKIMSPITNQFETNLDLAEYHIGVLEVLSEKSKGNLTAEEKEMLDSVLHQARMSYVDVKKHGPTAAAETVPTPPPPPPPSEEPAPTDADPS